MNSSRTNLHVSQISQDNCLPYRAKGSWPPGSARRGGEHRPCCSWGLCLPPWSSSARVTGAAAELTAALSHRLQSSAHRWHLTRPHSCKLTEHGVVNGLGMIIIGRVTGCTIQHRHRTRFLSSRNSIPHLPSPLSSRIWRRSSTGYVTESLPRRERSPSLAWLPPCGSAP